MVDACEEAYAGRTHGIVVGKEEFETKESACHLPLATDRIEVGVLI
jgi:hypothetical protein